MIKKRIFLAILSTTIIVATVMIMTIINSRKIAFSKNEYDTISHSIYETVESELTVPIFISLFMAKNSFLIEALKHETEISEEEFVAQMSNHLKLLKDSINAETAFVISEKTQRYYYHKGLNKVLNVAEDDHDAWYQIFINTRKSYDLDVDADQTNNNLWTVFINCRIEDESKKVLGVCGIGFSMEKLQNVLKEYEEKYNIKINFVNSEGLVQIDTDSVNIENAYLYDMQYGKEKDGYTYENSSGEYVIMRYVDDLNWYLVIRGNLSKINSTEIIPICLLGLFLLLINVIAFIILTKAEKKQSN